jgi:general secretion pathway protein C
MMKQIFTLINILLVTLISFFSVQLFYQVVSARFLDVPHVERPLAPKTSSNVSPDAEIARKRTDFVAFQPILQRDLFKTKASETVVKVDAIELDKLKQTQLNLKLWGTILREKERSYAVIEDTKRRKQGLFRVGDAIENASIKMILRKKVVLTVGGKDEILLMDVDKGKTQSASQSAPGRDMPEPYEEIMPSDEESVSLDRDNINEALKNINQLMSQVKVRPHFQDGKPSGLLLSHIQPNSIFSEMGLQNGDIIKGVNGNMIESVDDALKFYENLRASSSVALQIQRQGEEMNLSYQIE